MPRLRAVIPSLFFYCPVREKGEKPAVRHLTDFSILLIIVTKRFDAAILCSRGE